MLHTSRGELNALLEIFRRVLYSSPPVSLCGGLTRYKYIYSLKKNSISSNKCITLISFCNHRGGGYAGIHLTIFELLLHGYHLSLQPAAAPGRWP